MKVLIDTREQKAACKGELRTLHVGDYTTVALYNKFHIERKSLQDLYGTLTKGNTRFKYELFRAAYHQIHIEVHIEGTLDDFINKRFPKGNERKFSSDGLNKLISTFTTKYHLKFHFHKTRAACSKAILATLLQQEKLFSQGKRPERAKIKVPKNKLK